MMTFLTGCNLEKDGADDGSVNESQVYESTSEASVSTTVDTELQIINGAGTAIGSGL